jgi:phage terminase small subunit
MPGSRRRDPTTGLTAQRRRFADEYLIDFDATAAHARAGYKARGVSARNSAVALLANPQIQAYVQDRARRISDKLEISSERTLTEVARVAFFDVRRLFMPDGSLKPVEEWDDDSAAVVAGIEIIEHFEGSGVARIKIGETKKVRLASKVDALGKLALHFGLLTKKVESEVRITSIAGILEDIDGSETGNGPARSRQEQGTTKSANSRRHVAAA